MMTKIIRLLFIFSINLLSAQTDYSNLWEDFYSYNNVKDLVKVDNNVYALTDNAVFIYNTTTKETQKLSSVKGLSGETTSAIYYNKSFQKLVIGYKNGLIEVVDKDNKISISADIVSFNLSGEKSINHILEHNNKLYLSTPFAIVVYDVEKVEFGDTYFIGANSSALKIHQTVVFNGKIYAATENGIFSADVSNTNLIDFNNWQQDFVGNNVTHITEFNNQLYAIINTGLFKVDGSNITIEKDFFQPIRSLKSSETNLSVALHNTVIILDDSLNEVVNQTAALPFEYTLNNVLSVDDEIYFATKEFGILQSTFSDPSSFEEIHPKGPLSNDAFSITAQNNHLWVVYGGYTNTFAPVITRVGFSHFTGVEWKNTKYSSNLQLPDLVDITIDPENENNVFMSGFGDTHFINSMETGGLLEIEDDQITQFYNHRNSNLEDIVSNDPNRVTIRVSSSAFDSSGNLWMTNIATPNEIKKKSSNGSWSGFDISAIKPSGTIGLYEMAIDRSNTLWIGSRKDGVLVFNENGNKMTSLTTQDTKGNLPHEKVKTIAVDKNNRIWIGTLSGLVVYSNATGVFDATNRNANPIIILDDGIPKKLLGNQTINSIAVDGADNKWFGTDSGGVVYTNPNGQETLALFSKSNSPLPSNKIVKIAVDASNGKVYFATDKGIVAYNSKVAPFGNELVNVYAYPNPALKNHNFITIDGRNGTHLPKGTNVKILDVSGNLVYETNVVEGQQLQGGKVIWNKTNLAGKKVASGIYIVLLSNDDASETTFTKIAIVN